jgi:hypothetical protein
MCIEAEGNIDRFDVFFQNLGNNPTPQSFNDVVRLCMNRFGLPTTDADRAPQLDADRAPGIFPRDDQAPRQFPTDDIHPGLPVNDRATDEFKKQFEERFQEEFERQRRFQEEEIKRKLIEQQRQQNSATGNSQQGSGSTGNTGSGQNTQTLQQMIQKCVAAQGYWNGNNCELPPQKGNTPYEKCLKAGGVWMHASNECNLPTGSSQPHSRLNPPTFFGFFQQILIGN